jgi:hypothetical protein
MPVLADVDEDESQYATAPSTYNIATKPLPIINITKPPAPIAVTIPTAHDIVALPSPPDSTHSSLDFRTGDLESGRHVNMRQVPNLHVAASRSPKMQPTINADVTDNATNGAALVPLPVSPAVSTPAELVDSLPHPAKSDITDIMDEPAPAMENIPIEPPSPSPSRATFNLEPVRKGTLDALVADSSSTGTDLDLDPDPTIRLVGGGGTVGVAAEDLPPDEDLVAEITSITLGTSNDSVPTTAKTEGKQTKHKKNISSGLKKLGHLSGGGKQKKDSTSSSVKESN